MGFAHNSPFQEKMLDVVSTAVALKRGPGSLADFLFGLVTACLVGWLVE
jgi:hypothetical protein